MDLSKHVKFTKQQTFDAIVEGLAKQGWRRATQSGHPSDTAATCRYLTDDGLRCAAGQLVAPDKYDPLLDRKMGSIPRADGVIIECYAALIVNTGLAEHDLNFVRQAQSVHDQAKQGDAAQQAEDMRQGYVNLARLNNLVLPPALQEVAAA